MQQTGFAIGSAHPDRSSGGLRETLATGKYSRAPEFALAGCRSLQPAPAACRRRLPAHEVVYTGFAAAGQVAAARAVIPRGLAMVIGEDVWVTVRYRLFDSQGEAIEPSERELTYLHGGYGSVFPRIEQALAGHAPGFSTSVRLEPEDSFGDYDPELVRLAPRSLFPPELEAGMTFEGVPGEDDEGEGPIYIVTDIGGDAVVLDANHPLAGISLRFELRVLGVRRASSEEVAHERALAAAAHRDEAGTLLRRPSAGGLEEDFEDDDDDEDGDDDLEQAGTVHPSSRDFSS